MADLALTAAQIALTQPLKSITFEMVAAAAITKGQVLYEDTAGKAAIADASVAGTAGAIGVALNAAAAAESVSVCKQGFVYGYTLTSQDFGDVLYVSDTAGSIGDAAGTVTKTIGKVMAIPESGNITKIVYIDCVFDA